MSSFSTPLLFVYEDSVQLASAPMQEGHTLELFSKDGEGLMNTVFPPIAFI